jgi:hypothetical protein
MPCFSVIKTKLTDEKRIAAALVAVGFSISKQTKDVITAQRGRDYIEFQRATGGFLASGNRSDVVEVSRKYAEIGVKEWARRSGYSITGVDGGEITLENRRE